MKCISRESRVFSSGGYVYIPLSEDSSPMPGYGEIVDMPPRLPLHQSFPRAIRGSYDRIGDIAIIKLRNSQRAADLADAILRSGSGVVSVWKDSGIQGEYRTRKLEWLAGEKKTVSLYSENQARFMLDISKVYFSPRLATERMRLARRIHDGEYIIDMFAGIGPFGIIIAKNRDVEITCIDANPDAIHFMKESIKLNKLKGKISPVLGQVETVMHGLPRADRIIMNLPHDSMNYLDLAKASLKDDGIIHLYMIGSMADTEENMEKIRKNGLTVTDKRIVHGYSPTESLISLSLRKTL
ncbi:MAG: class I SAM-dependent methyltransferase family protein [Candidatus Thermoplasmatota archaeon]|nr:class I SAM-dependent methyltransferase family protein [Candidatus Thermoplasmatota archaeon]